jgi:hypothetical protein
MKVFSAKCRERGFQRVGFGIVTRDGGLDNKDLVAKTQFRTERVGR